jgi:SAM-dependent methyltransferase
LNNERGSFACSSFDHGKYPDIYYCPNCKNGFLKNIVVKDDENFVEDGLKLYHDVEDHEYIKNLDARFVTNGKIIAQHLDYFRDKSVLEIGSYYGAFAHEIIKVTSDYTGVEPSRHGCEYVKKSIPGAKIINATVDDFGQDPYFQNKKFDTIVMWDVIEHIPNPIGALSRLNKYLKDDGVVIFSTINIESTFSIAMGPRWPWFMDMHYYYFSDRGYIDILHRSGFVMKEHLHYPYYVQFSYFVKKVLSILGIRVELPEFIEKYLKYHLRLRLGDTVMIIGQKTSN